MIANKEKRITAFTLAEVLITLGIIGVVAAMTIPTLMNKTSDLEMKTAMKKQYSVLAQAQLAIAADNSNEFLNSISSCDSAIGTASGATCLKDAFKNKIKFTKECTGGSAYGDGNCFPDATKIKYLNGNYEINSFYLDKDVRAGFITNDGSSMTFYLWSNNCSASYGGSTPDFCGFVTVDVNGFKKPNQWGKDIYEFAIFANRIIPFTGAMCGEYDCNANSNNGFTCSSKYIYGQ